jgi:hypothetical protein
MSRIAGRKRARQRLRCDQRTRASALRRRRPLPLQTRRAALRQQRRKSSRRRFVIVSEKPEHWPIPLLLWNMTATSLQCQLRCLPCQASVVSVLPACVLFCADGRTTEAYVCAYICIRIICYEKGAERERERGRSYTCTYICICGAGRGARAACDTTALVRGGAQSLACLRAEPHGCEPLGLRHDTALHPRMVHA